MPDLKFADDSVADPFTRWRACASTFRQAILEIYRQVGDLELDTSGLEVCGPVLDALESTRAAGIHRIDGFDAL